MSEDDFNALMNYLSGNDTTKENSQEVPPEIPVERETTTDRVADINELVDRYNKGETVDNFPAWVQQTEKGLKIIPQELAIHIIDNFDIRCVKLGNSKGITLYKYEKGRYKLWSESDAKAEIKQYLPRKIRKYSDWDCVYKELITEASNTEESDLNANEDIINFKNRSTKT